jgi:hypothetical protein
VEESVAQRRNTAAKTTYREKLVVEPRSLSAGRENIAPPCEKPGVDFRRTPSFETGFRLYPHMANPTRASQARPALAERISRFRLKPKRRNKHRSDPGQRGCCSIAGKYFRLGCNQALSVCVLRPGQDRRCITDLDNPASHHDGDPIGERSRN